MRERESGRKTVRINEKVKENNGSSVFKLHYGWPLTHTLFHSTLSHSALSLAMASMDCCSSFLAAHWAKNIPWLSFMQVADEREFERERE